jgi:hypothetical protein
MRASSGLGFAIAAFVACGVLGFWLFGDRHDDWMLRTAQRQAVACLTTKTCAQIDARGAVVHAARPPLAASSLCAKPSNWHAVLAEEKRAVPFVASCTDGPTTLFHMGKFRDAGEAQWMVCETPDCTKDAVLFAVK